MNRIKHRNKKLELVINIGTFLLIFLNTGLFIKNIFFTSPRTSYKQEIINYTEPLQIGSSRMRIMEGVTEDPFTLDELEEAVKGLHLPTWSRAFVPCDEKGSEVTCGQIVHAWHVLNGWAQHVMKTPFNQTKKFLIKHLYDGVGNRFSTETSTFVLALMDNRSFMVDATHPAGPGRSAKGQAFKFHPAVILLEDNPEAKKFVNERYENNHYHIHTWDNWYSYEFSTIYPITDFMAMDWLLYGTMMYANSETMRFCRKHFGIHAAYFICNFLMYIPEPAIKEAQKLLSSVPSNIRVIGIHLRIQFPGQFYSYSVEQSINVARPFLLSKLKEKPTVFCFASDNLPMEKLFEQTFGELTTVIKTNALRVPDADHDSAMYDIALLEMCNECLLSYRSTYSFNIAVRTGKRGWFAEKESPGIFQSTNSQTTAVSALIHKWDVNDWQTNRRFRLTEQSEEAFRFYFYYFII